jgi:biotin operon repressor
MTTQTKKATAILAGSVVLASAAYALGSQAGDGGAIAKSAASGSASGNVANAGLTIGGDRGGRGFRRAGFGLDNLADRLGVSETALRDALRAIRQAQPTREEKRKEIASALTAALGVPTNKVTTALDQVRPDRDARRSLESRLAQALGIDAAKVRAAIDKLRGNRRRDGLDVLARELGVTTARLRTALRDLRPDRGDRRDRGGDRREELAKALGVTEDKLEEAVRKVRTDQMNAFATQLAQRLNISVDKVKDVLDDLPRFGRRHG